MTTASIARSLAVLASVAVIGLTMAACVPQPFPGVTVTGAPSTSPTPTAAPTPAPTPAGPSDEIALPAACEQAYSADMLTALQAVGPMNDPGITLYATRLGEPLEIIESGAPTLRCTWGAPGEDGFATNITVVTPDQAVAVWNALTENGFGCEDDAGGTICRIQSQSVDFDNNLVTQGETHFLRGDGWIATAWVGSEPDGYTQDIAATLWG